MKRGVPAVIAPQPTEAAPYSMTKPKAAGALLFDAAMNGMSTPGADRFRAIAGETAIDLPLPGLAGRHQIDNAGTAIACREHLLASIGCRRSALARGLRHVEWPARLQRLTEGPLAGCRAGWELWLDGGHNEGRCCSACRLGGRRATAPLDLVCGMLATKEPRRFFRGLRRIGACRAITVPGSRADLPADATRSTARAGGLKDDAAAPDTSAARRPRRDGPSGPPAS